MKEYLNKKFQETGFAKKELAEFLGVNPVQISLWLSGTRNPSSSAKVAIKSFFEKK